MAVRLAVRVAFVFFAAATSLAAQQLADEQTRRQALEFYRSGQEQMAAERFDEAVEAFRSAIDKDALLTVAHYQLGQAYMNLRRYASAIQAYKGCIEAMSRLHALEQSHKFEVEKQRDDEIRELRVEVAQLKNLTPLKRSVLDQRLRTLEQQRTNWNPEFRPPALVLLALGSAYFRNGDLPTAELQWQAAVEADPKYGEAHNNLAVVYMMTMRKKEAENAIKAAEKSGFRVNPQLKEDIRRMTS